LVHHFGLFHDRKQLNPKCFSGFTSTLPEDKSKELSASEIPTLNETSLFGKLIELRSMPLRKNATG
jgi:hypothetical protein